MSKKKGPDPSTFVVDSSVCVLEPLEMIAHFYEHFLIEIASSISKFTEGLVYSADNLQERQNLDLFEPAQPPAAKIPLIAYIHGGAWTERDKCRALIQFSQSKPA
jgi:hypothetical protein